MRHIKLFTLLLCMTLALPTMAQKSQRYGNRQRTQQRTTQSQALTPAERRVLGRHMISLQWISWDYFGSVNITKEADGRLHCVGGQESRENDDYLRIDGYITIVDADHLIFNGQIRTKVSYLFNGDECLRDGQYDFVTKEGRKYWRMQQTENCESSTDYIDIYYRK